MTKALPLYTLLPLLLLPGLLPAQPVELDSIAAVVNEDLVLKSELDAAMQQARTTLKARGMAAPAEAILQEQVLESLIIKQLQVSEANRISIVIDDRQLNEALETIARRQQLRDLAALREMVTREGEDYAHFREGIREELQVNELQRRVVGALVSVSAQEVDNYLANLQAQGQLEVEYHLAHILIPTPQAATPEQIQAIRDQAQALLQRLRGGADFAATAIEVSRDGNALKGGDMGWLKAGELPTLFSSLVPTMKAGGLSEVQRSPSGFHIIKLLALRSRGQQAPGGDLEQLRQRTQQEIYSRKFSEQLELWARQLRDEAYVEVRI